MMGRVFDSPMIAELGSVIKIGIGATKRRSQRPPNVLVNILVLKGVDLQLPACDAA